MIKQQILVFNWNVGIGHVAVAGPSRFADDPNAEDRVTPLKNHSIRPIFTILHAAAPLDVKATGVDHSRPSDDEIRTTRKRGPLSGSTRFGPIVIRALLAGKKRSSHPNRAILNISQSTKSAGVLFVCQIYQ